MDTLIQISSKYGHGKDRQTGTTMKIPCFIGTFDIHDDNKHIDQVRIHQSPIGCKAIYLCQNANPIYIKEMDEHECGVGAGLWLSSIILSSWIVRYKDMFKGKRVLELGCGVGLCGLSIAVSTCPRALTLTDCDKTLFNVLKQNTEYNSLGMRTIPSIQHVDWNNPNIQGSYDIIIASDCLYHNTKDVLLGTILCNLDIDGKLIMANPPEWSRPGFDEFIYALKEYGEVSIERVKLTMNKQYTKEIWMLIFTKKEA